MQMYTEQAWILKRAQLTPNNIALIDSDTKLTWTYKELDYQINKWVTFFDKKNYQKGDRIAVLSLNRIELFAILFACGLKGLMYVPLNFRLSTAELTYILLDCQPVLLIYDEENKELASSFQIDSLLITEPRLAGGTLEEDRTNWSSLDPWFIIYTGGTTGKPKGVVLSFEAVNWNAINTIISWDLGEHDCTLNYMPMFHTGGLNALCIPILMSGGTVITGRHFQAEAALKALNTYKTTLSLFVPTMYQAMLETDYINSTNFPTVRCFLSGGAPCPHTIYQKFEEKGILFKEGYGLTEAGPNNFFIEPSRAKQKRGTVGKCMQFNEVKVVNHRGDLCEPNEVGELYVAGKHVFSYYWNNKKETEKVFDGYWLKTGDLVKYDENGDYFIVGRKKEMIITGGENVYPQEVEQRLVQHPFVREAAVIGVQDEKWGECVTAFLSVHQCITEQEIIAFCKQTLGSYKVPKQIFWLDELPRTDVGKIDKKRLYEMAVK